MTTSNGVETPEPIPVPNPPSLSQEQSDKQTMRKKGLKLLAFCVIVSLVFGAIGGAVGAVYLPRIPGLKKLFANGPQSSLTQNITLNEDSDIIDVVKKASPAVVSIVISQDLSEIPGYGTDPSNQDPFFNFFGSGDGQDDQGGQNNGQDNNQNDQQPQSSSPSPSSGLQEVGAGSGFFISSDGTILTNKHVVEDTTASYTVITSDGKKYDATVLSRDPVNDLAIVKVNIKNAPFLQLADSSQLQVGQRVIAIGNSLGQYQNTVTSGIVSGVGREITAGDDTGSSEDLSDVIQTDAAINPGNSGGPLLDITGKVIGINTAIDEQGQLVGFALPASEAAKALASYQKNGKITSAFLGVRYIIITSDIASQQNLPETYGALIVRGDSVTDFAVLPGSPADKAGLMENDIILEVDGTQVNENNTLSGLLSNYNPGDTVTFQVYHQGKIKNVRVTLGSSPNS